MKADIQKTIEEAKKTSNLRFDKIHITDEIWNEIIKLKHLKHLTLYWSNIGNVPDKIINLSNLNKLNIYDCKINEFPRNFTKLRALEEIFLEKNNLKTLPDEFQNLVNVKTLWVLRNPLMKFPTVLTQLSKLENLNLSETNISNYTGLEKLKYLKDLNLGNCNLSLLPEQIEELKNLQHVRLYNNKISMFPKQLFNLINLDRIDLSNNSIAELPKQISNISSLSHLYLSNNKITKIPPELSKLKKLSVLSLDRNKIMYIPYEISKLKNLRDLDIEDNPINALKFGYFSFREKHPFHYLFQKLKEEKDIFNSEKLKYKIINGKGFIFFKTENNHAFIHLSSHQRELKKHMHRKFRKHDFDESYSHEAGFMIYVFGKKEMQQKILSDIRNNIDKLLKTENIEFDANRKGYRKEKFAFRFFYYPIKEKYERETVIDYDKLLKYKEAGENLYFDDEWGMKLLVSELLTYIGAEDTITEKEWNGTDTITNIRIENFKLFTDIQFNVSERINIILGRNGLGKTSLLQSITLGLLPLDNVDKSNDFESYISFGMSQSEIIINWGKEYRKAYVFRNELNEEKHIDFPQKLLLAYGVNLNTEIKLDHTKIIEQLITGDTHSYSTKSIFKDYSTDFFDPVVLLEKLHIENNKKQNKTISLIITLILETINDYLKLIEEKERISLEQDNADFFFKDINNFKLKTQHLSEGYKDHILLITDIIIRIIAARNSIFKEVPAINKLLTECNGVILIDEFDRHLHPVWQRKLLLQLKKDFPKIQFILTTHNIFSLQSAEGFTAHILSVENIYEEENYGGGSGSGAGDIWGRGFSDNREGSYNIIKIKSKPIKNGLSIKSIYNMYFDGRNNFFGYETEELFKQFYELIIKVKKQKATEKEINQFKKITNKLLEREEEVQVVISRELRQMERQTGKVFEL